MKAQMQLAGTNDPLFEHRFWLQIMGDHTRFILTALSPEEKADVAKVENMIARFDALLHEARQMKDAQSLGRLNKEASEATAELRKFKLHLLERQLLGKIKLLLTPTFINHMVNELDEYARILAALLEGKPVPVFHPLHHDTLWLLDAVGHSAALASDIDVVEKPWIAKSQEFQRRFEGLYLKAVEMAGYMRTGLREFPAFRKFHGDVNLEMKVFMHFLDEIREMQLTGELLDRLLPLIPDHMYREECYYLTKLAQTGRVPAPGCDPGKPRVEAAPKKM